MRVVVMRLYRVRVQHIVEQMVTVEGLDMASAREMAERGPAAWLDTETPISLGVDAFDATLVSAVDDAEASALAMADRKDRFPVLTADNAAEAIRFQDARIVFHSRRLMLRRLMGDAEGGDV